MKELILRPPLRFYCTKFEKRIYLLPSSDVLKLIEVEFPMKFPSTSRSVNLYSVYGDKSVNNLMFPMPITEGKLWFLKPSLLSIWINICRSLHVEFNLCVRFHLTVMDFDVKFFIDKVKVPSSAEKEFFLFSESNFRMFPKKAFPNISRQLYKNVTVTLAANIYLFKVNDRNTSESVLVFPYIKNFFICLVNSKKACSYNASRAQKKHVQSQKLIYL